MVAFAVSDPADRTIFEERWNRIRSDESIIIQTVLYDGSVAGHIMSFLHFGEMEVGYWIGREYWGRGIATRALNEFLNRMTARPVYARVVKDNAASLRVLEKCGFVICGEGKGFAAARGVEVEEFILMLESARERS